MAVFDMYKKYYHDNLHYQTLFYKKNSIDWLGQHKNEEQQYIQPYKGR